MPFLSCYKTMAVPLFRIFISAVSSEMEPARTAVASDLRARGLEVKVQEDFRQEGDADTTLRLLHNYIRDCSALILFVGRRSGDKPPASAVQPFAAMLPRGVEEASYTQWEYYFARHYGRRFSIYIASSEYKPYKPAPTGRDFPESQEKFIAGLKAQGLNRGYFNTTEELRLHVLREDWEFKWQLREIHRKLSRILVEDMRSGEYRREIFVDRRELTEPLFQFAVAETQAARGLLLAGRAGGGKSALLTTVAERILDWNDAEGREDIVIFLRGDSIRDDPNIQNALFEYLLNRAGINWDATERFAEFLDRLRATVRGIRRRHRNSSSSSTRSTRRRARIRCFGNSSRFSPSPAITRGYGLFSPREEFLEVYQKGLGYVASDPLDTLRGLFNVPGPEVDDRYRSTRLPVWVVPRLLDAEAEVVYRNYQDLHREELTDGRDENTACPACVTPWSEIEPATRSDLLTQPLYLHIWMRAFNGRPAPAGMTAMGDLFIAYRDALERRFPNLMADVLWPLVGYMVQHGRQSLSEDDESMLGTDRTHISRIDLALISGIFVSFRTSDILVPFGTDVGQSRRYAIFHEQFAEALMSGWFLNLDEGMTERSVRQWVKFPATQLLVSGVKYLAWRLAFRMNDPEGAYRVLEGFDFQLTPQNSFLFRDGWIRASVEIREAIRDAFRGRPEAHDRHRRNLYELGVGYIRLGDREGDRAHDEALDGSKPDSPDTLVAAIWVYRSLGDRIDNDVPAALEHLATALRYASGTRVHGNVIGHTAWCRLLLLREPPTTRFGRLSARLGLQSLSRQWTLAHPQGLPARHPVEQPGADRRP